MDRVEIGGFGMKSHRVEAAIERDGTLMLDGLPFHKGEVVEVIVLSRSDASQSSGRYPLRGKHIRYIAPTEPAAHGEWEAGK
jgi:hypothetical protein